jgi:hypothetical protein
MASNTFTGLGAELPPSHYLGADPLTPQTGQRAIDGDGLLHFVDSVDDATVEVIEQSLGATDRTVERHVVAGGITVQRDIEVVDPRAGHGSSSIVFKSTYGWFDLCQRPKSSPTVAKAISMDDAR